MLDDTDLERELDVALAHHEAGRTDLAEAGYRAVLTHNPDEPDALNLLGVILQEQGNLPESIALITRAVAIEPDFPEALTNLARALRATGDLTAAADAAGRAATLDPELAEAHLQLGLALLGLGEIPAAASALRRGAELAPQSTDAFHHLGSALLRLKDHAAAESALRTASRLDPTRIDTMVALGVALAELERFEEALSWHEKAATAAPHDATAQGALAVTLRRCLQPAGSIAACRRTIELAPERMDILLLLGTNLAETGQFDEAEDCFRRVLRLNPDSAEARRNLVMIGRETESASSDMERLRAILADPSAPRAERIAAGFGLGTLLDRAEDYDEAFEAFAIANRLTHENLAANSQTFNVDGLRNYVDWATEAFRKEGFAPIAEWGDPSELPVFVVGMPRSGTSLVEQIAASHPDVFGAGERRDIGDMVRTLLGSETHRVPPAEWDNLALRRAATVHVTHLRLLGGDAKRVIDKMPDNILLLGYIAVMFPGARVIVCHRDLRDVGLSCYTKPFSDGMVWSFDLTDLGERTCEIERLMEHWHDVLPLRMIDIQYEDLVADLDGESRRLIDFLGLEWDPACLAFHETERPVLTGSYWQVRQTLYTSSVGRWRHYRKDLGPLFLALARRLPAETDDDWDAAVADPEAALAVAVPNHRTGRLDVAEPIYRALLRRNPEDPTVLHLLGLLLVDCGQYSQSIALINRSLELRPDQPTAFADLARAQRAAGDHEAAALLARRAIELDPTLADAYVQLGCALLLADDSAGAIESLQQAVTLAPRSFEAQVRLAAALVKHKDMEAAAEVLHVALELVQDQPDLTVDCAAVLFELARYEEALALYRKAADLAPQHRRAQFGIAWTMARMGDASSAAELCREVLAEAPDLADMWLLLGTCYATTGRFDDAAEAYRRTLELTPDSVEALSGLVGVGRRLDKHHDSGTLGIVLRDEARSLSDRISAGFAEGREFDQRGEYDAAFEAYSLANQLLHDQRTAAGHVFSRADQKGLVDWLMSTMDPEMFAATAGWGDPSEVPVFVVGLPRSGTTLVEQIAASHPLVFGAGEHKDIDGILSVLNGGDKGRPPVTWDRAALRREAVSHVHRLRGLGGDAVRVIDKLPDNVFNLGQIAVMFPRAKIILCRRDLRDVSLSCFFQPFIDDAMMWTDDLADCGFRAQETARLMDYWPGVLPVPVLELQYETLVENLESESRRLIDFLGLEWDEACLSFHQTERTVLTASHWQVRQPLYASSVGRWKHYENRLGPLLDELAPVLPRENR
jgi:tetratricopeptide (TPR) repeat protein